MKEQLDCWMCRANFERSYDGLAEMYFHAADKSRRGEEVALPDGSQWQYVAVDVSCCVQNVSSAS